MFIHPVNMIIFLTAVIAAILLRAAYQSRMRRKAGHVPAFRYSNAGHPELKSVQDRLAVLERITVEKENSLEREIEQLRDR